MSHRSLDFVHTGPGTPAGRYLRSFWQPIFHSADLAAGRAKPVKVMNEQFTLYRGEGATAHLVEFRCAHRRAQLSVGWVEEDAIRCFYHGWKYDSDGQCIEQPPEPKSFASRVKIKSYPVREYIGLVFAYLGEGEPPEFPRFPDFEEFEGIRQYSTYRRACNYFNNLENFLDVTHLGFVHRDHVGGFDGRFDSISLEVEETEWGATCRHVRASGRKGQTQFGMPNIMHLKGFPIAPHIIGHREVIAWWVPIDDENHFRFAIEAVRMKNDQLQLYETTQRETYGKRTLDKAVLAEKIVNGEISLYDFPQESTDFPHLVDDVAQISQGRIPDRENETLGRGDAGVLLIRRIWAREMTAFLEGRPTKAWRYNEALETAKL